MARKYGYTYKAEAWIEVDPESDDQSQNAMTARKAADKALTDAGFKVTSTGKFGHREVADQPPTPQQQQIPPAAAAAAD